MNVDSRNQYYTVNLGSIEIKHYKQSIFRYWNRLHRLQKTIILLAFFLAITFFLTRFQIESLDETERANSRNRNKEPSEENQNEKPAVAGAAQQNKDRDRALLLQKLLTKDPSKLAGKLNFKGPTNERQKKVVAAFLHAWNAYRQHAWGQDELKPGSRSYSNWFNLGLTIVDSLDTIYIMNLQDEFKEARDWVDQKLDFDVDKFNNLFELTIRITGGLLSAYHLSGDVMFLHKAYDIGNRTLPAFNTKSSIPFSDVNLKRRTAKSPHWTSDSSTAEVASLQIELKDLSFQTGDKRFEIAASKVSQRIHELNKENGLVPIWISTSSGSFVGSTITLGARGDSYYEYLLKQWIQTGAKFDESNPDLYLLKDWLESVEGIANKLAAQTKPNNYTFIGELISGQFSPKMDHLVCFLPGNLALGTLYLKKNASFPKEKIDNILKLAKEVTETCYQMYAQTATGLSPEITHYFHHADSKVDTYIKEADRHNLLRPETVESLYYLYRITGDTKYQDYGWKIFEAFEKYTKLEAGGYTSIDDVTKPDNLRPRDKMESFFLAETLKYLYLLFEDYDSPNVDLEKFIFNTEAHLLPIYYK